MARTTQMEHRNGLDTTKRSSASCHFQDGPREKIVGRNDEAALVFAAKRGDRQAFETLVARHHRRILAVARRFSRIREDAEDITQETFQKAFVYLHNFEGKSSFSTWLTRIAINEGLMSLRRDRRHRELLINEVGGNEEMALGLEIPDSREGPESVFLQEERNRSLFAAISKLTPGVREAIELRELGELSTEEAARVLGLSVSAVKARVFHGRRRLCRILKNESVCMLRKQIMSASLKVNGPLRSQLVCHFGD